MSNSLEPGQARHFVGPGLGPNCLQNVISRRHLEAKSKAFYMFVIADIRQTSVSQHIKLIHLKEFAILFLSRLFRAFYGIKRTSLITS